MEKARGILRQVIDAHQPVISTQVIEESCVVATTKLKAEQLIVKNIVHNFRNLRVVNNDLEVIEQAIDVNVISQLSFWDSLIIAAAEKVNCESVLSGELNAGQTYRGVMVVDPFMKDDF